MTTGYKINMIYIISLEFLSLNRRRSSMRNVPRSEEKRLFSQAMTFLPFRKFTAVTFFFFIKEDILIPFSLYAITAWLIIVRNKLVVMRDYFYRLLSPTTDHR